MAADERWYFTKEQLQCTPSRKSGIDADKELSYRQQAANFIQDMGQRLPVNQLCINTAIVYMHRFYMFHSFLKFHRNAVAACALFLAAKVEEQPRKLEHVIKVAHICLQIEGSLDIKSEVYLEQAQQLVMNENIMLQTLGFDVAIDHPHTHIVKCCQLVRASKDLAQTSYIMATNSLHLTTMCLQCKPTVVACVCIHLACKWASWEIPSSSEGKEWFWYVEKYITSEMLEELTTDFLAILEKCPSRLKKGLKRELAGSLAGAAKEAQERKARPDGASTSGGVVIHPMPSLTAERTRSPVPPVKQDRSERLNRIGQERSDKTTKPDFGLPQQQQLERPQKLCRQPEKMERHDRKEKMEKDKRERTFKPERPHAKIEKSEHRIDLSTVNEKVRDFKDAKPEMLLNTSNNSNSQQSFMGAPAAQQRIVKTTGQASCIDKPSLLPPPPIPPLVVDDMSSLASVHKKHRHGQNFTNPTREHKDRKDKDQMGEKEPGQSATSFTSLSKSSSFQPGNQYDRIRHRKEENQSLKQTDSINNNHTDTNYPISHRASSNTSLAVPGYAQDKSKEGATRFQSLHQTESKQLHVVDGKLRSKRSSPKVKDKQLPLRQEPSSLDEEMFIQPTPFSDMRLPKTVKSEQVFKNEPTLIPPQRHESNLSLTSNHLPEFHERPNKEVQSQKNKEFANKSRDLPANISSALVSAHSSFANQLVLDPGAGGDRLPMAPPSEKYERHHERKEKHKHKSREKKEKHETIVHENQDTSKMPATDNSNQRITLTISKDLINLSHVEKDPIKLKITKEKLSPAVFKKHEAGDIPKLKIKLSKDSSITVPAKKSESRKRERSPKDLNMKSSIPKVPRIETRSSRTVKEDVVTHPHPSPAGLLPTPPANVAYQGSSKANGNNLQFAGGSFPNYPRKGLPTKSEYKNKTNMMPPPYQQPLTAGNYPYSPFFPCRPPMPNYFPNAAEYYYQGYHPGHAMPPPHDHGIPPLPREPPPQTPPPPPE